MTIEPKRRRSDGRFGGGRDLVVALVAVLAVFAAGALFDAFDRAEAWIVSNDDADEILALAVMLTLALGVVAFRRARQMAEERHLREEVEASYRALVEEAPAISYTWDPQRRAHLYVSPQVEPLLGYAPAEWAVDFDTWSRFIHPDDREVVLAASLEADADATDFVAEYRVTAADGRIVWLRDESRYVGFDAEGRPTLAQGVMFDITARKEAERRATESEERYRTIVERVPAVAYVWDGSDEPGDAPAAYISPQIESLLGYRPQDWLTDPAMWAAAVHPDDLDRVVAAWLDAVRRGRSFAQEYRIRRVDGRWIWLRDEANPVGGGRGSAPIYQGVMLDVTERRDAEQRLRDAEERWRTLLDHLPVTAYRIDYELEGAGTIHDRWIAPSIVELLGWSPQEWLADDDSWERRLHADDRDRALAAWDAALAAGGPLDLEYRMVHRDGRVVWVREETALAVRDGRVVAEGVFIDVTDRRTAEERLRDAEERYRSLVEQLPVAVYTDAVDEMSTAMYVSPRYERLTGYSPEQRIADPSLWVTMLHPDDRERVLAESSRTNETGDPFDIEYRIVAADGRTVWLHDHAVLVSGVGGSRIWQGVLQDVTERRAAQEALSRRDAILQATGFAAERFLGSPTWDEALEDVLERLGTAGEATRAFLYRNEEDEEGTLRVSVVGTWEARRGSLVDRSGVVTRFPWIEGGFARWVDVLGAGQVLHGTVDTFPEPERTILVDAGVLSVVAVPIFVRGRWWGYIGFDDVERPREWHETEIEALTVTANTLGAAIAQNLAASELAAAQKRYQTLIEQIPAMTYIQSADDASILYYSPQAQEVLGYGPDEWGGFEFWEAAIHADDRDRVLEEDRVTNATGAPFHLEYRLVAKDGRIVWIRDDAVLIRGDDGDPLYWQGVRFDITEQKEAEERLRSAEERYRGIVEHVPAAIYLDKADRSLRSLYVSPQIEQIAGVTQQEWLDDPELWPRMIDPGDRDRVLGGYVDAAEHGLDWIDEYRMRTADGRTIWVHDETTVLHDEQGLPTLIQGVIFDITERKLAEQALRESERHERDAAERLRALDDMKNTFLAAVSHELRSPLTSILGLSLTLERAPDMDDLDRDDLLQRLATNARKLDRLLKDLLDIDRLNRGIVEPQYRVTDVGALARRTVESLDALAGRDIVTDTESVVIGVDPAKAERIVENLLINAARHTSAERRIWLRVRPHDAGVLIVVEDEGPGVPEELRAAIFEPFRQGPSASPHSPGTGIGLSLVARFTELHEGRAWVEEREGGGASFRVYLPGHDAPGLAAVGGVPPAREPIAHAPVAPVAGQPSRTISSS